MNDDEIDNEIIEKGLTAPRVTMADIEAAIASEHFFTARDGLKGFLREKDWNDAEQLLLEHPQSPFGRMTYCVLVLRNGYTVSGMSAFVSPENFDAELGRKIARNNAVDQCWPLFGFELASRIARA